MEVGVAAEIIVTIGIDQHVIGESVCFASGELSSKGEVVWGADVLEIRSAIMNCATRKCFDWKASTTGRRTVNGKPLTWIDIVICKTFFSLILGKSRCRKRGQKEEH